MLDDLPAEATRSVLAGLDEYGERAPRLLGHGKPGQNDPMTAQPSNHGTGPGTIAPDGSAVDYYALLKARGEPELIHGAVPAGARILELGAGTGRVTRGLVELGHEVVAVDESAEMLQHIRGAITITSTIQDLALPEVFDVVLLMSYVLEISGDEARPALLRSCRRHVAGNGCVIIQRQPPEWYDTVTPGERVTADGHKVAVTDIRRPGPDLLGATMRYTVNDRTWTHTFLGRRLDDDFLEESLNAAGLTITGFLAHDRGWVRAEPV
ncbi:methyltransferase [Acrocarpospora phusangensis]|uniref:Methyltransferase n=1 Tax=Acrocarpospora phusangensis TaxID=1070424 RepID=A0A919QD15_9ACTN|nr:class I SAM-dependent methyltransferase [Acrocarpospora phusangensis]GIH26468.1 methyltransferase [Acrocarpospora phusangensis]